MFTKINGLVSGAILFFSNMMIMQILLNYYNITNIFDTLKYYWLEFTLLSNLTKILYTYNKDIVYRYTFYLVNKNDSIWKSTYPLYSLLPSNFSLLTLTNYIANCDREYPFKIDVWDNINQNEYMNIQILLNGISIYNLYNNNYYMSFIVFALCYQYLAFILYYIKYLDRLKFNYNPSNDINRLFTWLIIIFIILNNFITIDYSKIIMLFQIFHSIIYTHEYMEETYLKKIGSVNLDSRDFTAGIMLSNRPLFYLNIIYIIVPSFILLMC